MNKWMKLGAVVAAAACLAVLFKDRGDAYKTKYLDQAMQQWVTDQYGDTQVTWRKSGGSVSSNRVQVAVDAPVAAPGGVASASAAAEITLEYKKRDGRYQWVVIERQSGSPSQ